ADFADENHVRVVAKDRSQRGGEREPDLGVRLNLADAVLLVFDGVFHRDDLGGFFLDLVEGGVKRGGFAGTGGPGDENDAVRAVDQLLECVVDIRKHADGFQVELHAALIEQTHDHAYAVDHRDDGDADVDFAALHLHLDAAVLRQSLLGDVEPGHDLQPADDR